MFTCNVLSLILLLVGGLADAQDLPIRINSPVVNGDDGTCPTDEQLETAIEGQIDNINELISKGLSQDNPASSCADVFHKHPSGYYWIKPSLAYDFELYTHNAIQQYCDMNRTCCNSRGGWMRVANLDMTDSNQQCPAEFRTSSSPRRSCGRSDYTPGCVSTAFPVHGVEYSRVCGRVIGYQYGTPDGFRNYFNNPTRMDIDGIYLDGVSLTHGSSPRKHIWSFVCALDETRSDSPVCPCTHPDMPYTGTIPPFVGQDYFCETGSREQREQDRFYFEDPLWDRQGCGEVSTCCNHPLYFCKQLDQPTRDDIELRICGSVRSAKEDTPLEIVEIYVQ